MRVKDLKLEQAKEEIWTLSMQSLINLKYKICTETRSEERRVGKEC